MLLRMVVVWQKRISTTIVYALGDGGSKAKIEFPHHRRIGGQLAVPFSLHRHLYIFFLLALTSIVSIHLNFYNKQNTNELSKIILLNER